METILMTGATSFFGRRVAAELLGAGHRVRALLGAPTLAPTIHHLLEGVPGGVRDRPGLIAHMRRADGVVHLGGDAEVTRNVVEAAQLAGVSRLLLGSPDKLEPDTNGRLAYEDFLPGSQELADPSVVRVVVCALYGPGDPSAIGTLIALHLARKLIALPGHWGGCTFTHIDDAARAVRLAYERGRPGGSYLVGGEAASFTRFFELLSAQTGLPPPRFAMPGPLGWLLPLIAPSLREPVAELAAELRRGVTHYFCSAKAQRELGCSFRPLARGLAETAGGRGRERHSSFFGVRTARMSPPRHRVAGG